MDRKTRGSCTIRGSFRDVAVGVLCQIARGASRARGGFKTRMSGENRLKDGLRMSLHGHIRAAEFVFPPRFGDARGRRREPHIIFRKVVSDGAAGMTGMAVTIAYLIFDGSRSSFFRPFTTSSSTE